jgi:hypothetical protein
MIGVVFGIIAITLILLGLAAAVLRMLEADTDYPSENGDGEDR